MKEQEQDEVFRMLQSDLESLFKLVFTHQSAPKEGDIRLASVTLRKWLTDGLLGRFCNSIGMKASFFALDNSLVLEALTHEPSINYFLTAGIQVRGETLQGIYNSTVVHPGKRLLPLETMEPKELSLGEFLKQTRLYFEGSLFSCEEIIKYTANKLGGAHLDFNRPDKFALLERASAFMTYGGPPVPEGSEPPSEIYIVLEPTSTETLSGLHFEIIAAAASLVQVRLDGKPVMDVKTHPTEDPPTQNHSRFLYANYGNASFSEE